MLKPTIIIINGKRQDTLSVLDRGFSYGDGVFETLAVANNDIALWQYHYERLSRGLCCLGIELKNQRLTQHMESVMSAIQSLDVASSGVLKLMVTRGEGGRGYMPEESPAPNLIALFTPENSASKALYDNNALQGVEVHCCRESLPVNPPLSKIKTLNQLSYVLASRERQFLNAQEGLLFTAEGQLVEATARNVFTVQGGELFTPCLDECGVSGVMRRLLVNNIAPRLGLVVHETPLTKKHLLSADEVFLSNSVSGIWPVVRCDNSVWLVGQITRQLQTETSNFLKSHALLAYSHCKNNQ